MVSRNVFGPFKYAPCSWVVIDITGVCDPFKNGRRKNPTYDLNPHVFNVQPPPQRVNFVSESRLFINYNGASNGCRIRCRSLDEPH